MSNIKEISLKNLEKRHAYWRYFFELSAIPRPSRHEERACKWVIDYATRWGLKYKQDDFGNITVQVPANRKELEGLPCVALQGHLDMVCEKNDDVAHDFMNDPLALRISEDGEWVRATDTTLGADNGIAVAYEMALMDPDSEAAHGPLELVFTLDEETGLNGAANLGKGMISASYMINIDNSQEGMCCIGCAGGRDYLAELPILREQCPSELTEAYVLEIKGLSGGHSGSEIYDGRSSAIKIAERVLSDVQSQCKIAVSRIEAGDKRNAIARAAKFDVYVESEAVAGIRTLLADLERAIRSEMIAMDQGLEIVLRPRTSTAGATGADLVFSPTSLALIFKTLRLCPHGVLNKRSLESSGSMLSTNLAAVHTCDDYILFINNSRFSNSHGAKHIKRVLDSVFVETDAKIYSENGYSAWEAVKNSPLERLFAKEYEAHNKSPSYSDIIHGGIECGIIKSLQDRPFDVISIGPAVESLHAPTEQLHIESSDNMWAVISNMLRNVAEL